MGEVEYLLQRLEAASQGLVWQSEFAKSGGLRGLFETVSGESDPTYHGFGLTTSNGVVHVEAYCDRGRVPSVNVRRAIAYRFGIAPARINLIPCRGIKPLLGIGSPAGHHSLTGRGGFGTMGGFANDLLSPYLMAVSNNHVFAANNAGSVGDQLIDVASGREFGRLHRYVPLYPSPYVNEVDAAVGWIHEKHPMSRASTRGTRMATVGLRVQKFGARTGHTWGRVVGLAANISLPYPGLGAVNFRRCLRIVGDDGPFSLPGDSGSLVLDSNRAVVGLVFAGSTDGLSFANPVEAVERELEVQFS